MTNSKKLFIVRHGQTEYNRRNMVQGSGVDAPLNETGLSQARMFFNKYQEVEFDKIYISELVRTRQSVQHFMDLGIPFEELSGLNEISWGSQEGKPFTTDTANLYHETVKKWNSGFLDLNVSGGESPVDVMNRQRTALDHIMTHTDEQTILICMHGRAMRIMITWMLGYHLRYMDSFGHANLGLYQLTHTGSFFRIDKFNCRAHLNGQGL